MPKVYKASDVYKFLLHFGFQKVSQKWSHIKLKNDQWLIVILPMHSKDIPYWTFISILSQSNISIEQAKEFLWK